MKFDAYMKWLYSFALLGLTVGWGWFTTDRVMIALREGLPTDILVAVAATGLLGSLTTWESLVVQHYFRKAKPEENGAPPPA